MMILHADTLLSGVDMKMINNREFEMNIAAALSNFEPGIFQMPLQNIVIA